MTSGDNAKPAIHGNLWKQSLAIGCALLFLWLAFRGTDLRQMWGYFRELKPGYVLLTCVSGLLSHLVRAWRWLILLKPLSQRRLSLFNSFTAVMVGYAVNVVIPRGGEVARLISISKSERLPWVGVLSTMFIDRLLDIALLVMALGCTLVFLPSSYTSGMSWLVPGGVFLTAMTVVGLMLLPHLGRIASWLVSRQWVRRRLSQPMVERVETLCEQFAEGTQALTNPVVYPVIALMSVGIWLFYWLNFYLMIRAFGLEHLVSAAKCLVVFTIGSVGVLVPTPGNVGSFHYLVSLALTMVSGVNHNLALTYATAVHLISFLVITVVPALVCLSLQSIGRLRARGSAETDTPAL